jgi:hypothetical protein
MSRYEDNDDGGIHQMPDRDEQQFEHYDLYINAEVLFNHRDRMTTGKVRGRKRENDGSLRRTGNNNPILDTRSYMVSFEDGSEAEYSANVLAENMYAQCDTEGNQYLLREAVTDHRQTPDAVVPNNATFQWNGKRHLKRTTKGWQLCVQWRDGTTTWERLAELKESNPVEVAEYSVAVGIDSMPAFKWWVPYTLKKRERIIAAVNKQVLKKTHKFGIRIPRTVEEAVVSRESVRIALTLAALNDLQVKASDIQNAYLTAPLLTEKIWTVCGAEFGEDQGKNAVVVRALYGLKSAGQDYGVHIAHCMVHLGYTPCEADRDVWMKAMVRPDDTYEYFAYCLPYVDDILMIHHDGVVAAIDEIDKYFKMKPDSNSNGKYERDVYLGAKFTGVWAYSLSPSKYVKENVRLVEEYLAKNYDQKLNNSKGQGERVQSRN